MNERIERLREAVEREYGCQAHHVASQTVIEKGRARKWKGSLEIFDLRGPGQARRCYAWSYKKGLLGKQVMVLELEPRQSNEAG